MRWRFPHDLSPDGVVVLWSAVGINTLCSQKGIHAKIGDLFFFSFCTEKARIGQTPPICPSLYAPIRASTRGKNQVDVALYLYNTSANTKKFVAINYVVPKGGVLKVQQTSHEKKKTLKIDLVIVREMTSMSMLVTHRAGLTGCKTKKKGGCLIQPASMG